MENFSTVLWIVVIAAAMIFNVVSQSRKQAKKQARQAGDAMGLTVTARYRIVVPAAAVSAGAVADDPDDEFTRRLQARQAAAVTEVV